MGDRDLNDLLILDASPAEPPVQPARVAAHILQIGYEETALYERALLLRAQGYEVESVIGNDAAQDVLSAWPAYDLFILGSRAPEAVRLQMVEWLQANYPRQPIIALHAPGDGQILRRLPYHAPDDDPERWLAMVLQAVPGLP